MTNFGRAFRLIELYGTRNGTPRDLALELAAAGLLAPALPPVTKPKPGSPEWAAFMAYWEIEPMWETPEHHGLSAGHEDGRTDIYIFRDGDNIPYFDTLTPEEAEALAKSLLAAARHAKEKQ